MGHGNSFSGHVRFNLLPASFDNLMENEEIVIQLFANDNYY